MFKCVLISLSEIECFVCLKNESLLSLGEGTFQVGGESSSPKFLGEFLIKGTGV